MRTFACALSLLVGLTMVIADASSLADKLMDVTIEHIKTNGLDEEVERLLNRERDLAWLRHEELFEIAAPALKDKDPVKVARAITIFSILRGSSPAGYQKHAREAFKRRNAEFFDRLDKTIYSEFGHFHSLTNSEVHHHLALYLGMHRSDESYGELLRIINRTPAKAQALTCLTWHGCPWDMDVLFPFMIEDSETSRSLPYQFRSNYGGKAVPYLKRALKEAQWTATRAEVALELVRLNEEVGFDGLRALVLGKPTPPERTAPAFDYIRQCCVDYFALPPDVMAPEIVAVHLERKKAELIQNKLRYAVKTKPQPAHSTNAPVFHP